MWQSGYEAEILDRALIRVSLSKTLERFRRPFEIGIPERRFELADERSFALEERKLFLEPGGPRRRRVLVEAKAGPVQIEEGRLPGHAP